MPAPVRILVTGVSGFLGYRVAERLRAEGHACVGTFSTTPVQVPGVDCIPLHLEDAGPVRRLLRDLRPTAIIHSAAQTDAAKCQADPAASRLANVEGTASLLAAAAEFTPASRVVFVSTDLVFDGTLAPYGEDAPAKPLSVYASQKVEAEQGVLAHPGGVVLRAALLFGEPVGGRGGFLRWMIGTLVKGETLTLFEDEYRTPASTRDVADALARVATAPELRHRMYHAGGPDRLSRLDMGRLVCQAMGLDSALLRPARLADSRFPAPRPADVSLQTARLRDEFAWNPESFAGFLARVRRDGFDPRAAGQPTPP